MTSRAFMNRERKRRIFENGMLIVGVLFAGAGFLMLIITAFQLGGLQ